MIEGLKNAAWAYIKSATFDNLETNREALCEQLHEGADKYIRDVWGPKESRVVRCFTRLIFNLDIHSSQRVEGYHPTLKSMTNGQLSLENSAIMLIRTLNRIVDDLET